MTIPILTFLLSELAAASALAARSRRAVHFAGLVFYLVQAAFAAWLFAAGGYGSTVGTLFAFDAAGSFFYLFLVVLWFGVFHQYQT